ncbi:MAG: hypothetical protein IJ806_09725 [Ruminococcus sp.]|nr:hypothetical protein [Ruminococcus sp.]
MRPLSDKSKENEDNKKIEKTVPEEEQEPVSQEVPEQTQEEKKEPAEKLPEEKTSGEDVLAEQVPEEKKTEQKQETAPRPKKKRRPPQERQERREGEKKPAGEKAKDSPEEKKTEEEKTAGTEKHHRQRPPQGKGQENGKRRPNSGERAHIKATNGGRRPSRPRPEDIRAARRREKLKKRLKNLIIFLVLVLFALIVYITKEIWVPKLEGILDKPQKTVVNDGTVKQGNFPIELGEGSVKGVTNIGSYLLKLDKNQLKIYNEDGAVTKSFSHNYADPVLKASEKRMLIYDKGGSSLMVVNRQSQLFTKTTSNNIIMAEIASNNNIAVITKDERYAGILYIFDQNGREIFKWSSNADMLSVTFTDDGDGCYVTTFAGKDGALRSAMRYFRFDQSAELVKNTDLPVIALKACETDSGEFLVAGDTAFLKLDSAGNIVLRYDYPSTLVDYALDSKGAALVFGGVQRKSSRLVLFSSGSDSAEPDKVIDSADGSPVRVHVYDSKVVFLKKRSVNCYDFSGDLLATADLTGNYTDFVYFGDNIYFEDFKEINKISFSTKA